MARTMSEAEIWQEGAGCMKNQAGGPLTKKQRSGKARGPSCAVDALLQNLPKQVLEFVKAAGAVNDNDLAWSWSEEEWAEEMATIGMSSEDYKKAIELWAAAMKNSCKADGLKNTCSE